MRLGHQLNGVLRGLSKHVESCCRTSNSAMQGLIECDPQVVDEDATEKKRKEAEEAARAKGEEGEVTVEPVKKASTSTEWDWTVQNDNKPLWTRSPKEVRAPLWLGECCGAHCLTTSAGLYRSESAGVFVLHLLF